MQFTEVCGVYSSADVLGLCVPLWGMRESMIAVLQVSNCRNALSVDVDKGQITVLYNVRWIRRTVFAVKSDCTRSTRIDRPTTGCHKINSRFCSQ